MDAPLKRLAVVGNGIYVSTACLSPFLWKTKKKLNQNRGRGARPSSKIDYLTT